MDRYIKEKACNVLLRESLPGDRCFFPKCWIVGDDIALFRSAALRSRRNQQLLTGELVPMEEYTFEKAYMHRHGNAPTNKMMQRVCTNLDQSGTFSSQEEKSMLIMYDSKFFSDIRIKNQIIE